MRELVIVFDSVRYDQFEKADAANLKSLGPLHKAYSHGRWTRPSMASLLSGYLPYCPEVKSPWEPSWAYLNFGEEPRYFFNTSPWCHHLSPLKGEEVFYDPPGQAPRIVEDAAEILFGTAVVLLSETHVNYCFRGEENENEELAKRIWGFNHGVDDPELGDLAKLKQIEAIEYLDGLVGGLLDSFSGRVYFTSDHGELFGRGHHIGHDPSAPFNELLFEVPLIVGEV